MALKLPCLPRHRTVCGTFNRGWGSCGRAHPRASRHTPTYARGVSPRGSSSLLVPAALLYRLGNPRQRRHNTARPWLPPRRGHAGTPPPAALPAPLTHRPPSGTPWASPAAPPAPAPRTWGNSPETATGGYAARRGANPRVCAGGSNETPAWQTGMCKDSASPNVCPRGTAIGAAMAGVTVPAPVPLSTAKKLEQMRGQCQAGDIQAAANSRNRAGPPACCGTRRGVSEHPHQLTRPSQPFPSLSQRSDTPVSPDAWGTDAFPPAPCTRWDGARCGEHSPRAARIPLSTTGRVPAPGPLTHRSPAVLGEALRFHGHDLKLRRGALQQEAAGSGPTGSGSPHTEHLPSTHPPRARAPTTHIWRFLHFCLRLGAAWGGQGGAGLGAGGCERGEERSVSALGCREQGP